MTDYTRILIACVYFDLNIYLDNKLSNLLNNLTDLPKSDKYVILYHPHYTLFIAIICSLDDYRCNNFQLHVLFVVKVHHYLYSWPGQKNPMVKHFN